jgi:hypothetical protein
MKYVIIILTFCAVPSALADRGLIPFNPDVEIFEPNQRALIAWDGAEEILLLSTDLSASESTMVLEVLPLYSEPEVKKGDMMSFVEAIGLINRKLNAAPAMRNGKLAKMPPESAGEITFHKRIGAHDISIARLVHAQGFVDWVKSYLLSIGIEREIITKEMTELIETYIADDFVWFVFDVVSLGRERVTNEPIQYRFKTKHLYYPLRITKTGTGTTSIELIILTPQLLKYFPGLPIQQVNLQHEPIPVSRDELKPLGDDIYELLKGYDSPKLRIWRIEGSLKDFDDDLLAR